MKITPKESPKLTNRSLPNQELPNRASDRPFAEPPRQRAGDRILRPRPFVAAPAAELALGQVASSQVASGQVALRQRTVHHSATQSATQSPYLVHWLQSGGNLDFCVLALCSCVLTVLCHQTTVLSPSSMATTAGATPASAMQPVQIDFALKAGLFTTSPKIKEESDSE